MPAVEHISASSIRAFKQCPKHYQLAFVEGLREANEPAPFRMGTAWHKGLEIAEEGGSTSDAILGATEVYETIPGWADEAEWLVEREVIANGLAGYLYHIGSDEYETIAVEQEFDLPLVNPETGRATSRFRRVGKIDRIVRCKADGRLLVQENKTTSRSIDSGSTYWNRLRRDTQSMFYILATKELYPDENVYGLLHDVFHKPTIRPKMLTQADTKKFMGVGEYFGQAFTITPIEPDKDGITFSIDYRVPEVKPGAKEGAFAIRETPAMYGARMFQDLCDRSEVYYARREVPFTNPELLNFRYQLWYLQKNMADMERTGFWVANENQCEATFICRYLSICNSNAYVCDGVTVPPGFRRQRPGVAAGGVER